MAKRKFTKYPQGYVKASTGDYGRHASAISFDVVSTKRKPCNSREIESITRKVLEQMNGLAVPAFDIHDVDFDEDYWIEEYGVTPSQYGADFVWEGNPDEKKIIRDLGRELSKAGYELLGEDFYSLDHAYRPQDIDQWFD